MKFNYDIIVVGAGHAGCEAAAAAANLGSSVLLITMDMTKIAQMSCNPAVGGVAKGQIVREIDALGGYMGIITDRSTIQFRMLNRSKGAAMWSPRAQCDKNRFSLLWREQLESMPNVFFWQDEVVSLIIEDGVVRGVITRLGVRFESKAVILTNGTFLNGKIHVGRATTIGGRSGDMASVGISDQLESVGFSVGRMKTGTPARIDGKTIDFSKMTVQDGDADPSKFSYLNEIEPVKKQLPCYTVFTSKEVHDSLRDGFADSPLFNGTIKGVGPRYCPSIEDKLRTFASKDEHQLFLEPEGFDTNEYYLNGFSSSLPWNIQFSALTKIEGFENTHFFRPGYAIEYDYFPPTQLLHTLETKALKSLYFAGQINGTTGYEEAAAQGMMAAINAHLKINNQDEVVLRRDEAYIGVLIDDLVTKGVDEPYRMFTSRAEHRILLRGDNADLRLTPLSFAIGLATQNRFDQLQTKLKSIDILSDFANKLSVDPAIVNPYLEKFGSSPITQKRKLVDIILRNEITIYGLAAVITELADVITENNIDKYAVEEVEITIKYSGYIEREKLIAEKLSRLENIKIQPTTDFNAINSLSIEARQKLTKIKPSTIGQASRIPGVSPSDINVLLVYFGR